MRAYIIYKISIYKYLLQTGAYNKDSHQIKKNAMRDKIQKYKMIYKIHRTKSPKNTIRTNSPERKTQVDKVKNLCTIKIQEKKR